MSNIQRRFRGAQEITRSYRGGALIWEKPSVGKQPLAYVTRRTATGAAAVRTFTGVELGAPSATRDILIAIPIAQSSNCQVTGVLVNNQPATLVAKHGTEGGAWNTFASLWRLRLPAGATGTIEVTHANNSAHTTIFIYAGDDVLLSSVGTRGEGAGTLTTSLTLSGANAGDKLFAFGVAWSATGMEWTGAVEQFEDNPTSSVRVSAAEAAAAAGSNTVSFTLPAGTRTALIAFTAG